MRKPIIAITPKTGNGGDEDSKFCYVFPNFINCVSACGGIPIQLSSLEGSFQVADLDELLERVGRKRGMLISGGEVNTERAAITVLDEYRGGKLGRITLETPVSED